MTSVRLEIKTKRRPSPVANDPSTNQAIQIEAPANVRWLDRQIGVAAHWANGVAFRSFGN